MRILRITDKFAYIKDGNQIICKPLTPEARKVLDWENRNIPAND